MNAKKVKWFLGGLLAAGFLIWAMGQYDYSRIISSKKPIFARLRSKLADGGSVQYFGFGYTITDLHELRWGIEMQPETQQIGTLVPYRIGQTLDYWTPFFSRERTRFIVETNQPMTK